MEYDVVQRAWSEWKAVCELGRGSYGVVYKAEKTDKLGTSVAAVKVIRIPWGDGAGTLVPEGLTDGGTRIDLKEFTEKVANEIRIMQSLKGTQNVVSVEDYKVLEEEGGERCVILIRMELLTPLNTFLAGKEFSERDTVKLGRDICAALKLCEKKNVVHRDVKPENIFVNEFGDYKLGDFGIARVLDVGAAGTTGAGTAFYMAPEVASYKPYDARADVYSLCLTLYRLTNDGRLPFFEDKRLYTPRDREEALRRRMSGEALPKPVRASDKLANVILKGCAFRPEDRFENAAALDEALASLERDGAPLPAKRHLSRLIIPAALVLLLGLFLLLPRLGEKDLPAETTERGAVLDPLTRPDPVTRPETGETVTTDPEQGSAASISDDTDKTPDGKQRDNGTGQSAEPGTSSPAASSDTPAASSSDKPPATTAPPVTTTAPVTYTVAFNANGGSGAPGKQTKKQGETLTLSDVTPTRDGYVFRGWSESSTAAVGTWQAGGKYAEEESAVLYAVWRRTYTIRFNGGNSSSLKNMPGDMVKVQGETLYLPANVPTRSGERLAYWYSYNTTGKYYPGDPFTVDADTTFYAEWTIDWSQMG